jgi:hypothetical protein
MINLKFNIGDNVYFSMGIVIDKTYIKSITIFKKHIHYDLFLGGFANENEIYKTFEEARAFCIGYEKERHNERMKEIMSWKDSNNE